MSGYVNFDLIVEIIDLNGDQYELLRITKKITLKNGRFIILNMSVREDLKTRLKKEISALTFCLDFTWGSDYQECARDISLRQKIVKLLQ